MTLLGNLLNELGYQTGYLRVPQKGPFQDLSNLGLLLDL